MRMKSGFESLSPHRGRVIDVAQVIRKPTAFVIHFCSAPGVHYSWRDAKRPHVNAEGGGLVDVGFDPRWSRGSESTTGA